VRSGDGRDGGLVLIVRYRLYLPVWGCIAEEVERRAWLRIVERRGRTAQWTFKEERA
jgi:hypothetical protein